LTWSLLADGLFLCIPVGRVPASKGPENVGLIRMTFGSERGKNKEMSTSDERKKELRRVYRKLKGVRSQISMKMKELKKEVGESDFSYDDDLTTFPEIDPFAERDVEDDHGNEAATGKDESVATQFELKMLVDQKAKLRKRFKKLSDEVKTR
jgi:transposase